jgi:5-dehydro-2-deoxygluconokinase
LGREFLLEIIPGGKYPNRGEAVAAIIEHLYGLGIRPDWWKLEPFGEAETWARITDKIRRHDPYCRGVLILGLTSGADTLHKSFGAAAAFDMVRGFAVGRTIVAEPIEAWLKNEIGDDEARARMEATFASLTTTWRGLRSDLQRIA